MNVCIFGLDTLWCVGAAVVIVIGVVAAVIINKAKDVGESHPGTIVTFKAAGIAICTRLHGPSGTAWSTCVKEVNAEADRATLAGEAFDTSNVPSIPPNEWP